MFPFILNSLLSPQECIIYIQKLLLRWSTETWNPGMVTDLCLWFQKQICIYGFFFFNRILTFADLFSPPVVLAADKVLKVGRLFSQIHSAAQRTRSEVTWATKILNDVCTKYWCVNYLQYMDTRGQWLTKHVEVSPWQRYWFAFAAVVEEEQEQGDVTQNSHKRRRWSSEFLLAIELRLHRDVLMKCIYQWKGLPALNKVIKIQ